MAYLEYEGKSSWSPEDKFGPSGYDPPDTPPGAVHRWIRGENPMDYRIDFWNKEDAAAATVDVYITDDLDPKLEWSTFKFIEIGFLDWRVTLEPCQYFNIDVDNVQIDLSRYYPGAPVVNLVVNVEGTFDPDTGHIEWAFHALDPITREPPEEPLAGFLPPFTASGWEIGWVNFSVEPQRGLPTGTQIGNQSWVKFDVDVWKPAPPAGPFINTIDSGVPSSHVNTLPAESESPFLVCWNGADDPTGAGLHDHTVYVSDNGGPFTVWLSNTTDTCAAFYDGVEGHTYAFYSTARDNVGNVEAPHPQPDTSTTVTAVDPKPVVTITSPAADATVRGVVDITAEATDNTGIGPAEFYFDGALIATDYTAPYQAQYDTRLDSEGTHTIMVRAWDTHEPPQASDWASVPVLVRAAFDDIHKTDWFWTYVEALAHTGITSGCAQVMYCPYQSVTRAQMAKFLCTAAGKTELFPPTPTFTDVQPGPWYYGWVERLADPDSWGGTPPTSGIACPPGVPPGSRCYGPFQPVTREQMAKFLCIATGHAAMPSCPGTFCDVWTEGWACPYIERLADPGSWGGAPVTSGCACPPGYAPGCQCFCPTENCTRAQMAKFLALAFGIPH
jgi:hypothetical protein